VIAVTHHDPPRPAPSRAPCGGIYPPNGGRGGGPAAPGLAPRPAV